MEVGPRDGERIFRTSRTESRKKAVKDDDEDVPFCVSKPRSWFLVSFHRLMVTRVTVTTTLKVFTSKPLTREPFIPPWQLFRRWQGSITY